MTMAGKYTFRDLILSIDGKEEVKYRLWPVKSEQNKKWALTLSKQFHLHKRVVFLRIL